jgi:MFS family permease
MAEANHSTLRHSLSVLRSGLFARFVIVDFISMVGSWMQTQAQQFLVEENAASSLQQALISFALTIVIPIFNPWGGTIADRLDRRRILFSVIFIQALLAALVGVLVHRGVLTASCLWPLAVVSVVMGITHAFEGPAFSAFLPQLVPREKLAAAVGIDRSIFHGARVVGPALAGIVVAWLGTASAFFANALSYLGPLIILLTIPRPPPISTEEARQRRSGFGEGWRHVRSDAPTFRMVLIMALSTLFGSPFVIVLLTFYARRTLNLDPMQVGWLMSLTGIGALSASFSLLAIPASRRVFFVRLGSVLSVAAMLTLAWAQSFAVAAMAYALLTGGLNFIFGVGNQLVQERAPDPLRGRVSAVASLSFVAVIPFSGIFVALLDGWLGMRHALIVCACGYAATAALILSRRWPQTQPVLVEAAGEA